MLIKIDFIEQKDIIKNTLKDIIIHISIIKNSFEIHAVW